MGGLIAANHFKLPVVRFNRRQYENLKEKIINCVENWLPWVQAIDDIRAYNTKPDFGDMDMLMVVPDVYRASTMYDLRCNLNLEHEWYINGGIWTIPIDGFQVDFNLCRNMDEYALKKNYFDYSPQGNALGKLAHRVKLKFGHDGLKFTIREEHVGGVSCDNSHAMEDVVLLEYAPQIHQFFDVDHQQFVEGFETEENIFEWISKSKYFHSSVFSFEKMNHRSRIRDMKRPDYHRLLEWVSRHTHLDKTIPELSKQEWCEHWASVFPILRFRLEECRKQFKLKEELKLKFDFHIFKQEYIKWKNVEDEPDKDVGQEMAKFLKDNPKHKLVTLNDADIRSTIFEWLIKTYGNK